MIWVTGTCSKAFKTEVQFGHAGAKAGCEVETADAKNTALRAAGAIVPNSYDDYDQAIKATYESLVKKGIIKPKPEPPVPKIPMDYAKALKEGLIRKPSNFICTISDDRGEELLYGKMPISEVFKQRHRNRRSTQHPLVQTSVPSVCHQIYRDDYHGYGGPWTCGFGCS